MPKILFLLPEEIMTLEAREALTFNYPEIEVVTTHPRAAVKIVRERLAHGLEIVAARAVTATMIKQAQLNITVVTIPITAFDIIRAISQAKAQGKPIAVIAHSAMVWGIEFLAEVLGVEIRHYATSFGQDYEKPIQEALANGAEVILGGAMSVDIAKRRGIPFSLIKSGKESLLQAAQEALGIKDALEIEAAKRSFFQTVVNLSSDGIIMVDKERRITAVNPVAQKLINFAETNALGQPIEKILPQIDLNKTMTQGKDSPHSIVCVNNTRVMCSSAPIVIKDNLFGAIVTLKEASKIQQMEGLLRKEIYARGHVAAFRFEDIIGKSAAIVKVVETAKDFAATSSNVLILGETGTGKEVFAQSIHNASKRSKGPFVAVNCASLPAQLLESELFGYVAGAFTGAAKEGKPGLFEVAHGGTIFLDELGEMDYVNQGRLLRVLQEKSVVRLGSFKVIQIDVRVIAATNKDLETLVMEKKFRDDLYYRLNVLRLETIPLREQKSDIHLYAETFLRQFSEETGRNFALSPDAVRILEEYSWPGNVRECRNLMERVAATAKTDGVNGRFLAEILNLKQQKTPSPSAKEDRLSGQIIKALEEANGNYTAAAQILGINRATLYRRMKRLNIDY